MSAPLTVIPMDPEDLEKLPPADLDACDHCGGHGGIWPTPDPQDVVPCPVCHGDGVLPEYGVAS